MTDEQVRAFFDPFFCECRAYGRLKESNREHLAIRCHGYIMMDKALQDDLREKDDTDWAEEWNWKPGTRFQALVKDLFDADLHGDKSGLTGLEENSRIAMVNVDVKSAPRAVRAVKEFHRIGVFVQDINNSNIVDGRMIEFSSAWTAPHPCFTAIARKRCGFRLERPSLAERDAWDIDEIIESWNIAHAATKGRIWDRAIANREYLKKLRSYSRGGQGVFDKKEYGQRIKPENSNWEKKTRAKIKASNDPGYKRGLMKEIVEFRNIVDMLPGRRTRTTAKAERIPILEREVKRDMNEVLPLDAANFVHLHEFKYAFTRAEIERRVAQENLMAAYKKHYGAYGPPEFEVVLPDPAGMEALHEILKTTVPGFALLLDQMDLAMERYEQRMML
ncbi:hypothetical protein F4778DRAFT_794815 [Xylariomycetidae sp. FL2044]|nr:hypothetical protein F4778DRAFT_794815 [Xylariomycetidae sp. FL2044]